MAATDSHEIRHRSPTLDPALGQTGDLGLDASQYESLQAERTARDSSSKASNRLYPSRLLRGSPLVQAVEEQVLAAHRRSLDRLMVLGSSELPSDPWNPRRQG